MNPNVDQRVLIESLIRSESAKLERFFRTKVPESQIEDLTQATFVTYVERAHEVATNPTAFLWGIARRMVLKHWESYRRAGTPFDSATHSVLQIAPGLSSLVDKRHRILRALQTLPADQQMAVELVECEELTIPEAAIAMGVSVATLNRYLAAARASLRASLGGSAGDVARTYRSI